MEEKFSPQDSLQLIESMIGKIKTSYHDTGIGPILWGAVVAICSIISYFAVTLNKNQWFNIWYLTLIAIIPQVIISIKEKKQKRFTSLTDDFNTAIWTTFGLSMFMLSIIASFSNNNLPAAVYMLLYGFPTIITGWGIKFKAMTIGGIICWLCALISLFVSKPYSFLLMAISAMVAWLIPGLILNAKYRMQKKM